MHSHGSWGVHPVGSDERNARTFFFGALRLIGVPAALIWILAEVAGATWGSLTLTDTGALVLGFVVNQVALCLFAVRMQFVLRAFEIQLGWLAALRIHLQSMFYFFALPMTVGLEIARLVKVRQVYPSATVLQASSALLLDRLLGAGSALAMLILCWPFVRITVFSSAPGWVWLAGAGLLAAGGTSLLLSRKVRHLAREAWSLMRGRWLGMSALFALSMLMHVVFAAGVQFIGTGLGLPLTLADTAFAIAGGMLFLAIPVSFAGLGPAEAGVAGVFLAMGYPASAALATGALPYLARLVGALEGAVWELLESGSVTIAAMRRLIVQRWSS
jgi:uncharacterized membrane protein YbhN (UPF0104 family)